MFEAHKYVKITGLMITTFLTKLFWNQELISSYRTVTRLGLHETVAQRCKAFSVITAK